MNNEKNGEWQPAESTCKRCHKKFTYAESVRPRFVCDDCKKDRKIKYDGEYSKRPEIADKKRLHSKLRWDNETTRVESLKRNKEWRRINQEKIKKYKSEHGSRNDIKERRNKLLKEKRAKDPAFKLNHNMSCAIYSSLLENKSGWHWEYLVGYTVEELKKHIEKQFKDGMSWENYGQWHIDHIIPKSIFNYSHPSHTDFKRCWGLGNLRPLWAEDNHRKFNKIERPFQPSLQI